MSVRQGCDNWLLIATLALLAQTATGCGSGTQGLRLDSATHVQVFGATVAAAAGSAAAAAGDVNGDGLADIAIGAPHTNSATKSQPGAVYLIFGSRRSERLDLRLLTGGRGYAILGGAAQDHAGVSVANAGDVNRDGRPDLLLGAPDASFPDRQGAGAAYVVFGSASSQTVDLGRLGSRGYLIEGSALLGQTGQALAGIGDVNGDGRPDALIGAPGAGSGGAAYVVFGQAGHRRIDLRKLAGHGYRIDGSGAERAGAVVAAARDVNLDGRPDLLIGAPDAGGNGRAFSGSTYVVFSRGQAVDTSLAKLLRRKGAYRIDGANAYDHLGSAVAGIGDVNGDGRPDVALGAPFASGLGGEKSGVVYIVQGYENSPAVDLSDAAAVIFRVDGAKPVDEAGTAVAGAGDENGDGRPDLLIGAPLAGFGDPGAAYVVFSPTSKIDVNLQDLGAEGKTLVGSLSFDNAGTAVASAGDFNGDGASDVLVGASAAYFIRRPTAGSATVVFSGVQSP